MSDSESRTLRRWALFVAAGQLILTLAVALVTGGRAGRAEAAAEVRSTAQAVVRDEWLTRLEAETKRIAAEAATSAAERAVREAVTPLAIESAAHRAMDDQRHADLERRIDRAERPRGR